MFLVSTLKEYGPVAWAAIATLRQVISTFISYRAYSHTINVLQVNSPRAAERCARPCFACFACFACARARVRRVRACVRAFRALRATVSYQGRRSYQGIRANTHSHPEYAPRTNLRAHHPTAIFGR